MLYKIPSLLWKFRFTTLCSFVMKSDCLNHGAAHEAGLLFIYLSSRGKTMLQLRSVLSVFPGKINKTIMSLCYNDETLKRLQKWASMKKFSTIFINGMIYSMGY